LENTGERAAIFNKIPEETTSAAPVNLQELQRAVVDLQRRVRRLEEQEVRTDGRVLVGNPAADQALKQLFTPGR
jgi:hypothetical protein